jgi:hypothetical protein
MLSIIRIQQRQCSHKTALKIISHRAFFSQRSYYALAMITTIPFGWVFAFYQNIACRKGKRAQKGT